MSVIRNKRDAHFTITPNETLRDHELSLQAKGLLALMLSYPDDWDYNMEHLQDQSTNGRDAHRAAMRELIEAGYVRRVPHRQSDGTVQGWDFEVSDTTNRPPGNPSDGESTERLENRPTGRPSDGKSDTTNTYSTKTEHTKTPPTPPIEPEPKSTDRLGPAGAGEEALRGLYNEDARKTLKRTDREAYKQLEQAASNFRWTFGQKKMAAEVILERRDEALAALREAVEGANTSKGSAYKYWQAILNDQAKQPAKSGPDSVDELLKLTGATGNHPQHGPFTVTMVSNDGRTLLTDNTPPLPPEEVRSCLTT